MRAGIFTLLACLALCLGVCGCSSASAGNGDDPDGSSGTIAVGETVENDGEDSQVVVGKVAGDTAEENVPMSVGETVESEKFRVTLTDARVDDVLRSDQSSTFWRPQDGACFVILEFDVTALTSDRLPVDGEALSNFEADFNGNSYGSWTLTYLSGQLWLYFHHTYLDANMPCHLYAYTSVPVEAFDSGSLSVDLDIAGEARTVTIR